MANINIFLFPMVGNLWRQIWYKKPPQSFERAMQTLINQLLEKRYLLAVLTLILGGLVSWGARYTSIDSSFNSILSEDDPYRQQVDQVNKNVYVDPGGIDICRG